MFSLQNRLFQDISRFPFQLYTKMNDLKFEILKIFREGAHRASSIARPLTPLLLGLGRFNPSIRALPVSPPPPNLRGCALVMGL